MNSRRKAWAVWERLVILLRTTPSKVEDDEEIAIEGSSLSSIARAGIDMRAS